MRAIEFKAKIKNGTIQIPEKHRKLADGLVRIIILTEETEADRAIQPAQDMDAIQSILKKLRAKKVFQDINNPTAWQRSIREEWNERTG